jgi:chitinase
MRAKLIGGIATAALAAVAVGLLLGGRASTARTTTLSPYVDASLSPGIDMAASARKSGVKDFTLGFIVSGEGCAPEWGGRSGLAHPTLGKRLAALRAAGGDVRVSFGGADGTELARACAGVSQLASAYRTVIDRYGLSRLDFDIEGDTLADAPANTRRAQAIARLQKDAGLDITFTLPAMPDGLTKNAVTLLADAKAHGVHVSAVNILAMDYSESQRGDMGRYAIRAATAAHAQIERVLTLSGRAAWTALGVTPMIGVNDIAGEVFTLDDAEELAVFARDRHIGLLSIWAADRDKRCTDSTGDTWRINCSGVAQRPLAFTRALAGAAGRPGR